MDGTKKILIPIAIALLVVVIYASTFIVNQYETAIKLRLGEIVASDYDPGLHFKVPLLNNVIKFDSRIQTLDSRPQRFLTIEKKDVIVDSYAKWRINNAAQFFRSTGGNSARTARLLSERINTSLRDEFGKRTIQEVVSEDRMELMQILTKQVDTQAAELGVEVVDVRVKKIDLPPEVSESVYNRMRAERERVARDLRAKGSEAAERIRADADRQRTVIRRDRKHVGPGAGLRLLQILQSAACEPCAQYRPVTVRAGPGRGGSSGVELASPVTCRLDNRIVICNDPPL
jgi:membrane protease subunit HflC